jgi:hypothetical protein
MIIRGRPSSYYRDNVFVMNKNFISVCKPEPLSHPCVIEQLIELYMLVDK